MSINWTPTAILRKNWFSDTHDFIIGDYFYNQYDGTNFFKALQARMLFNRADGSMIVDHYNTTIFQRSEDGTAIVDFYKGVTDGGVGLFGIYYGQEGV